MGGQAWRPAMASARYIQLVHSASHHRMPAIHWQREFATAGGLMTYGSSIGEALQQVGRYTGRILKVPNRRTYQLSS